MDGGGGGNPAGAAVQAVGSLIQGIAGYQAGQFNRDVARQNARASLEEGSAQEIEIRHKARAVIGDQLAAQAESGFTPGTGSGLDALRQSAVNAELDVLEARRRAASQAQADKVQGKLAHLQGKMALVAGVTGAASSIAGYSANYAQTSNAYGYGGGG